MAQQEVEVNKLYDIALKLDGAGSDFTKEVKTSLTSLSFNSMKNSLKIS
jgi:hypothetical protein